MHEQMASEVIIINALLDNCDLHKIGQDFTASAVVPSNLHLELIQRTPHVTCERLCRTSSSSDVFYKLLPGRIRPRVCASSAIFHHRLHVPPLR